VKIPDLLIASVAARNDLTVVHYDGDYELIAAVTGQRVRWAAPRGSP
jgi:predicted nucleic acid-binding protein